MPEGIDQAADAFRNEIAPASSRPRDESGRFAAATRPESMFQPRPVEGDPLTGDTRDGGEDARLAAAERRIADGRAEEGDEQSLQNAARPRSARRDDRHANDNTRTANDNAERIGSQELENQDPDRPDGEPKPEGDGDAEGDAGGDAEGEGGEGTGPRYEVTVDGQTMEVSLPEALRGYIREQTFHKRMSQVNEARQAVEQEAQHVGQARDYYMQKLAYLDRLLAELTPPQPNWDQEFAANPHAAHEKQKAYGAIFQKQQMIAQEMQRTQAEAQQEYDRTTQKYAVDQFSRFVAEANIRDEKALNAEMSSMRGYAKMRGFGEGEIATVYDKRMLLVLRDAAKYNQMMATKPKPVIPGKGKTLAPGVATPVGNATRRSLDEAQQKLAKTGRVDDAALVFQRLIR
jgi:hypothetical protein